MSKIVDILGQRFGNLTVIERGPSDKFGKAQWWCQCDCGSEKKLIAGAALRKGLVISCGCNKMAKLKEYNESKVVNEIGNQYGYLTVIRRANENECSPKDGRAQWVCQCKCGKEIITTGKLLRDGHKLSCGCLKESKGELRVIELLEQAQINYAKQYAIYISQKEYECQQTHPYFFDFAVLSSNGQLQYLIEYDGMQHFIYRKNSDFWSNEQEFLLTQKRDQIKNNYCKQQGIPLIRIPYTRFPSLTIEDLKLETSQFIIE